MRPLLLLPFAFCQCATAGSKASLDEPADTTVDWCGWLADEPGLLYDNKDNPWIQQLSIGGRFHYQAAYVDGNDVRGRNFTDTYSEVRRFRLESEWDFLRYFSSEINVNLVDDRRFRSSHSDDLDWGYDSFDELSLSFDLDKALNDTFGDRPLDKIELSYGRTKLKVGAEAHQSSREIYTIERSDISDKIGGDENRTTGARLTLGEGDWDLTLGLISGEIDEEALAGWSAGQAFYGSLEWEPNKHFRVIYDHVHNNPQGDEDALGYSWVGSLSAVYETPRWGVMTNGVYGDNGSQSDPSLEGEFWGVVVMPWTWLVEDRLQAVVRYQYQGASEAEGIRVASRYSRAYHDDLLVDDDGGYGDSQHSIYAGLNYHICGDNLKLMGGVEFSELQTRTGSLSTWSYMAGVRSYF